MSEEAIYMVLGVTVFILSVLSAVLIAYKYGYPKCFAYCPCCIEERRLYRSLPASTPEDIESIGSSP